ncbi:MAG: type II secretion system protein N [Pseudomonas sp.]|uniref:type II secretion system protein N n=1 Tax=Pseudomonas sp. TaxID=306 RepID=UPI003392CBA6
MLLSVAPRRLQRHAPLLIGLLLIVLMSVSLAWQTVDWMRLVSAPTPTVSVDSPPTQATPTSGQVTPLFGAGAPAAGDSAPPATNLRLTLNGSFVNADPQRSSALVQLEGSKPQRFAVGAELQDGIRLHAVYRDRIELERDGRLETLPFPTRSSNPAQTSYSDPNAYEMPVGQMDSLEEENAALLRERMDALRQQMEAAGSMPGAEPTDQPMESD